MSTRTAHQRPGARQGRRSGGRLLAAVVMLGSAVLLVARPVRAADPVRAAAPAARLGFLRSHQPVLDGRKRAAFATWRQTHRPDELVAIVAEGDNVLIAAVDAFDLAAYPDDRFQYTYFDYYRVAGGRVSRLGGSPRFSPADVAAALAHPKPFTVPEPGQPAPEAVPEARQAATLLAAQSPELEANKRLAFDYFRIPIGSGRLDLIQDYASAGYIQHNPILPSGRDAFVKAFQSVVTRRPEFAKGVPGLVQVLAEGDRVVLVQKQIAHGVSDWHFDMFRIAAGSLVEHWDAPPDASNVGVVRRAVPNAMFSAALLGQPDAKFPEHP